MSDSKRWYKLSLLQEQYDYLCVIYLCCKMTVNSCGCCFKSCVQLHVCSVEQLPAEVLEFVPREFGLQLSMGQSNNPEAPSGEALQSFTEPLWH